jgi:hypothetical protein
MSQPTVTKQQLLDNLRHGERSALEKLAVLPAEAFEAGCYENGWNGRQILAHIAAIEWTYPKLIELARSGPAPEKKEGPTGEPASRPPSGGIDSYNQRQIERYAGASVAELLETFRKNRATTIAAIDATEEDLFLQPVKSAGGVRGPLGTVLNYIAFLHVNSHVDDITAGAAK